MHITAKFQTAFGEVEVKNITEIDWGVTRQPHVNHELGQKNHNLAPITILRTKSLQQDGKNKNETEIVKLTAATGDKAYFKGRIRIATPSDENNPVQTLEWDRGHVVALHPVITPNGMVERIQIVTTNLKVDDSKFDLAPTT